MQNDRLLNSAFPNSRKGSGINFVEVAISAFLMIALAGMALDISLVIFGWNYLDTICRDAVRSAAQQSDVANAILAAQSQLKIHATDGYYISQPALISLVSPDFVYNDYGGNPPENTSPYVTTTCMVNVKVPAPVFFFGATFSPTGSFQLRRRYTFPIIKTKFYPST